MPVIPCGCGVQLCITRSSPTAGARNGATKCFEEMRPKLAAAKPHQRVSLNRSQAAAWPNQRVYGTFTNRLDRCLGGGLSQEPLSQCVLRQTVPRVDPVFDYSRFRLARTGADVVRNLSPALPNRFWMAFSCIL